MRWIRISAVLDHDAMVRGDQRSSFSVSMLRVYRRRGARLRADRCRQDDAGDASGAWDPAHDRLRHISSTSSSRREQAARPISSSSPTRWLYRCNSLCNWCVTSERIAGGLCGGRLLGTGNHCGHVARRTLSACQQGPVRVTERRFMPAPLRVAYSSTCSEIASASSTSIPR